MPRTVGNTRAMKRRMEEEVSDIIVEAPTNLSHDDLASCNFACGSLPVPGKFLLREKILELLKNPGKILESVPLGKKNDVFYVVDNSENLLRKQKNIRSIYYDDCGVWDCNKCSTVNSHSLFFEGKRKVLTVKDNLYHMKKKGKLVVLDPQPDENSVLKIHRYYCGLKGDENYRRRITVVTGRGYKETRALFEYCGIRTVQHTFHGQNKKHKYVRTDPRVLKKILENVKDMPSRHAYRNMLKAKHISPRNFRQVYNLRYFADRRKEKKMSSRVTDEKRAILTMLAEDPSVQAVIHRKDKPPCVILYSDDQFSDMRRNLECDDVLGLDCSHKFGDCYVTMTVYQNSRTLHEETNEPLLYLGPVLLHWDEEFLTYVYFFSHIIDKLKGVEPNFEVKVGEQLGASLFKALKHSFPTAEYMLNSHHLKETVTTELNNACNLKRKEYLIILDKMFGSKGLASSRTVSVFQKRVSDLTSYIDEYPKLRDYFGELQLLLYQYVCEPQQKGVLPKLWVNGNDEALDYHLSSVLQQKTYELPELMEKFSCIRRYQMQDLEGT